LKIEFRKAVLPRELRSLAAFDRRVFTSDHFPPSVWKSYESYWMLLNNRKIGCCAFEEHVDFQDDLRGDGVNPPLDGSLYIGTTGVLPEFRHMGFGQLLKSWQIAYARYHRFTRIVTNMRQHNAAIVALNRKFRFQIIRTTPRHYEDPPDGTVVMELLLGE
jgi:ribosomal protein S18 acetylase RimI-like enzyme